MVARMAMSMILLVALGVAVVVLTAVVVRGIELYAAAGGMSSKAKGQFIKDYIKKAIIMAERVQLSPEDLELSDENLAPVVPLAQAKEDYQRRYINEVLARNSGNRTKTAHDLGVDPRTIFRHLEREERGG